MNKYMFMVVTGPQYIVVSLEKKRKPKRFTIVNFDTDQFLNPGQDLAANKPALFSSALSLMTQMQRCTTALTLTCVPGLV